MTCLAIERGVSRCLCWAEIGKCANGVVIDGVRDPDAGQGEIGALGLGECCDSEYGVLASGVFGGLTLEGDV